MSDQHNTEKTSSSESSVLLESKVLYEFSGVLRCAALCIDGKVTDQNLSDTEEFINKGGFCQICENKFGTYASFHIPGGNYIVVPNGRYQNEGNYHSIRYDGGLFVFEEDSSHYEESISAIYDFNVRMDSLSKGVAVANHLLSMLDDLFDDIE